MILRLKGVKPVRSKGRIYYYHRKSGTRIPGLPGTPSFMATLFKLSSSTTPAAAPGTLGALVLSYKGSPEYASLAPATRTRYEKVLGELRGLDGMPLSQITSEWLYRYRDKKMAERKRAWTNLMLALLQSVFNWGMRRGKVRSNPVMTVQKIRRPRSAPTINRPWTPSELATVLEEAPPWLRVPIALAAYTGLREADVLTLTWSGYDGLSIKTRSQKTGVVTWVPAHPRLKAILDHALSFSEGSDRIVVGVRGHPIGRSTLTTAFFALLKDLRVQGRVGAGLSFHGLRHTLGTALAEAGADAGTIAAILGHETTAMAAHYSRHANRRHLAADAMKKLENQTENRDVSR